MQANNYEVGVYQDGEVWIQTEPLQLNANGGMVYLTTRELHRMLDLLEQYEAETVHRQRIADRIDGYDRDDLGESPDY